MLVLVAVVVVVTYPFFAGLTARFSPILTMHHDKRCPKRRNHEYSCSYHNCGKKSSAVWPWFWPILLPAKLTWYVARTLIRAELTLYNLGKRERTAVAQSDERNVPGVEDAGSNPVGGIHVRQEWPCGCQDENTKWTVVCKKHRGERTVGVVRPKHYLARHLPPRGPKNRSLREETGKIVHAMLLATAVTLGLFMVILTVLVSI